MTNLADGTPATTALTGEPGTVFRSELNPVDFLTRSAYIYPDKVAVVDGEHRYSYQDFAERAPGG